MWGVKKGICDRCGTESNYLYPAFGKHICDKCKSDRPNKGLGNAGLIDTGQTMMSFQSGLHLLRVSKSNGLFGQLYFSHYPGSKGIPGRSLCYLIYDNQELLGIIGANSPPCNYKIFRRYFACDNDNVFLNNNVYRLIVQKKNIGTRILKMFRETVRKDYITKYKNELFGLVTFVEPPRTGAIYKADNWQYLGLTQGKRMTRDKETWDKVYSEGVAKHIYGYKFKGRFSGAE